MSNSATLLEALTREQVRDLLMAALDRPCVLWPNQGVSWVAELVNGYPAPRVIARLVQNGAIPMDDGPIAAVGVTLLSDAYDPERKLATESHLEDQEVWLDTYGAPIADLAAYDGEVAACAWSVHVDARLGGWVDTLMEQLADHLGRGQHRRVT